MGACREVLEGSRAGYYAWRERPASARATRRAGLAKRIKAVHAENREVYGSPRVHRVLVAAAETVCENTVAKVMSGQRIRAKSKKKYVPRTTDSRHERPVADNVLDRDFAAGGIDQRGHSHLTKVDVPFDCPLEWRTRRAVQPEWSP